MWLHDNPDIVHFYFNMQPDWHFWHSQEYAQDLIGLQGQRVIANLAEIEIFEALEEI